MYSVRELTYLVSPRCAMMYVGCRSDTGEILSQMGAGDFFGEIGILNLDGGVNKYERRFDHLYSPHNGNMIITRNSVTVHTSAKAEARLTWIRIRDPDLHQNLIVCSLAHCQPLLKI